MKSLHSRLLAASTAGICLAWANPAFAQDTSTTSTTSTTPTPTPSTEEPVATTIDLFPQKLTANYLDLTASLGYSGNPFLDGQGNHGGSVVARASARGVHSWRGELSHTSISGFVEGSSYFSHYGLKSIFAVDANHSQRVSETVTLFGGVGASADVGGQLSNRFLGTDPIIVDPSLPPPPTNYYDPDVFSFAGKQYRIYGNAGASIRVSPRGSLSISGGAQRWLHSGSPTPDYTNVFGHLSYDHTLSERTIVGGSLGITHTVYDQSDDHTTIITPDVHFNTQLSEEWFLNGSLGVSFSDFNRFGNSQNSTDITAHGSLCKVGEDETLCAHVSRATNSSGFSSLVTTTSAGLDWSRSLNDQSSIRLSAGYTKYHEDTVLNTTVDSTYWRAAASYDRHINPALSVGVNASVRAYSRPGPNPNQDYGGSVYVRYHIGDVG